MRSTSTRLSPSRVITSRQSVPKLLIRMSPLAAKARPLGRVPVVNLCSSSALLAAAALAKRASARWPMKRWLPSGAMRITPPRASADHSVPSGSARMHSGRCSAWPMVRICARSTVKPRKGLSVMVSLRGS